MIEIGPELARVLETIVVFAFVAVMLWASRGEP
jgi:hypothetical protein